MEWNPIVRSRRLPPSRQRPLSTGLRLDHGPHAPIPQAEYEDLLAMPQELRYDIPRVPKVPRQMDRSSPKYHFGLSSR